MNKRMKWMMVAAVLSLFVTRIFAFDVPLASEAPVIDGDPGDVAWARAEWVPMKNLMWGTMPGKDDFSGRFKLVWTQDHLFLLAEITDDILYDSHPDPVEFYWEDDALEIFIDADASGGDHLHNYNAFAYHISLDNQAADMGPFLSEEDRRADKANVRLFPGHVQSQWKRSQDEPNNIFWEVKITVMGDDYRDSYAAGQKEAKALSLKIGDIMGFMLAYCDSDGAIEGGGREHFMGDVDIEPVNGDRNLGYINASVFGRITLVQ
ncbi:MAG: CBM9 family sugar-binding protein [Xanthomonadales bacterium]|nr:CBM9 family sugar-binding protein [Xanthomonadales bacterium]